MPRRDFIDERGVEITSAIYRHRETLISVGNGARPLNLTLDIMSPGLLQTPGCFGQGDIGNAIYLALSSHAYFGNTAAGTGLFTVVLPHQSGRFGVTTSPGGQLPWIVIPRDASYVTGSFDTPHTTFSYVGGDGTEATFTSFHLASPDAYGINLFGNADLVRFPNGETWTYRYNDANTNFIHCGRLISRVRSIVSSRGYALQFDYAADPSGTITSPSAARDFVSIARVTAYNKATTYCDEALLQSCASVAALNTAVTFSYDRTNSRITITRPNGETAELTLPLMSDMLTLTSVTRPGGVTRTMTSYTYTDESGTARGLSLTEAGRTWDYSFAPSSGGGMAYVEDPAGELTHHWIDSGGHPYLIADPLWRMTEPSYDDYARFHWERFPEGNMIAAAYDTRGNLNLVQQLPKPGSGLPSLQASANYPANCTSSDRRTCNRPTSQTDRNGNVTDYTYDPAHGGILSETGPPPTGGAPRPQTRYTYTQRYAWVSNGSGGYVQTSTPVWLLASESRCIASAPHSSGTGCVAANDEVVTTYDYGPDSGPNNLWLRGTLVNGPGVSNARTCYGYDALGRRISETGPGAGLTSCP